MEDNNPRPMGHWMGHPMSYWMELEKRAQELNVAHLVEELAIAYGKIGFYEKRIKEMASITNSTH